MITGGSGVHAVRPQGAETLAALRLTPRPSVSPTTLTVVGATLAILPAILSTPSQHARWGVLWYVSFADYVALIASAVAVLVGVRVGQWRDPTASAKRPEGQRDVLVVPVEQLQHAVSVLLVFCFVGYGVWLASAIRNGLTLGLAVGVMRGDPGASELARQTLVTVPGLSTLTEVGPVVVAGLMLLWRLGYRRHTAMTTVLGLAFIRGFLNSERLAVVEVLLPVLAVALLTAPSIRPAARVRKASRWARAAYLAAPILLIAYFAITERNRSWSSYYSSRFDGGLMAFSVDRIWAYYATATNNGVIYATYHAPTLQMPELTLAAVLRAPVIGDVLTLSGVASMSSQSWADTLSAYANPEFNNTSAFLPIVGELGLVPALVIFFIWGVLIGRLYSNFRRGSLVALCGYAAVGVGLLELARYPYFMSTRVVPVVLALWILRRIVNLAQADRWGRHSSPTREERTMRARRLRVYSRAAPGRRARIDQRSLSPDRGGPRERHMPSASMIPFVTVSQLDPVEGGS